MPVQFMLRKKYCASRVSLKEHTVKSENKFHGLKYSTKNREHQKTAQRVSQYNENPNKENRSENTNRIEFVFM